MLDNLGSMESDLRKSAKLDLCETGQSSSGSGEHKLSSVNDGVFKKSSSNNDFEERVATGSVQIQSGVQELVYSDLGSRLGLNKILEIDSSVEHANQLSSNYAGH